MVTRSVEVIQRISEGKRLRLLFEMDRKDYDPEGSRFERPSVRGIIVRDGKVAMVHSKKYDYYKFPGGGIEPGEDQRATLIREVKEESGLVVIPETIREFGWVHRIQKGSVDDIFIQDNFYYLCETEAIAGQQKLDDYEAEAEFVLAFVTPQTVTEVNRREEHGAKSGNPLFVTMLEREARVMELLIEEGMIQ